MSIFNERSTGPRGYPSGSKKLINALCDRLTRKPKRRPYSLVMLTGSEPGSKPGEVIAAFEEHLSGTLARVAHIEGPANPSGQLYDDVALLLDKIKKDLSLHWKGQGWRKRGFPRFEACRDAIAAWKSDANERKFSKALYDGLVERRTFFAALDKGGKNNIPATPLLAPVRFALQRPILEGFYKFWLRHAPWLSWVPKVAKVSVDFVTYVRSGALNDEEMSIRILVEALLRDLEEQLRSSVYSVGRRRRRPVVLLMSRPPASPAEVTFIEKYDEIVGDTSWAEDRCRTPAQIVAVWSDRPGERPRIDKGNVTPEYPDDRNGETAKDTAGKTMDVAADELSSRPSHATCSPAALRVTVPLLDTRTYPPLGRPPDLDKRRSDYLLPGTSMVITAAVVAALVWGGVHFPWPAPGACSDTWVTSATHERVGITDGNCPLSGDKALLDVEQKIAGQNRQVQSMVDNDQYHRPYQTVVLFSPLTVSSADVGQNSLDEARGVQIAQAVVLQQAKHDPNEIPVKVLLANSGDRIAAAPQVASRIVARVDSDRISAVIGISQSRSEAHQAIKTLSDNTKVPIIGTVTTGDQMLDSSTRYYQIAPQNVREADTVTQFLNHQQVMAGPQGQEALTKDAVVIEDPRDEYSQNLAHDFRESFTKSGGHHVTTYDYGPPAEGPPAHASDAPGDVPESSAGQLVHDVCKSIGDAPDMIFYASRAQELPGVLDKVAPEPACHGRQLSFMGTDEDTRFIADGSLNLASYQAVHFYNASFSNLTNPATLVARQFIADYKRTYGTAPGDSGAGDADDAFVSAWQAVNQAYQQDPTIPPDAVTAKMADGKVSFTGVTGLITFNGTHDTTRVPADKPIFVMIEQPTGPVPLLKCGQYAEGEGQAWTTWGTGNLRFPCPRDSAPPS